MNKPSKQQLINEINKKLSLLANYDKPSKEQEFSYPIFKRNPIDNAIIKFTEINKGTVVWKGNGLHNDNIRVESNEYLAHTDSLWEDVAYDSDRELWDKQTVYCWNNEDTHNKQLEFYDALNKCIFAYDGTRNGAVFNNYEAIAPDKCDDWILEAFNTLED